MKIVSILMVNDDSDVILPCLLNRVDNFDLTAIVDSSHDDTSDKINIFMQKHPGKFLYEYDTAPLTIKYFRTVLLKMLDGHITDDDWIFQLDTDIFPCMNSGQLRAYVRQAESMGSNCGVADICQFYPTPEEINEGRDFMRFQYYSCNWRSRIIYKNRSKLFFRTDDQETPSVPDEKKYGAPFFVQHYQYRSPKQIQKKIDRAFGIRSYSHIISQDWHDYIIDEEFLTEKISSQGPWRRGGHSWRSLVKLTKEKREKNG